jgi:hypothetical protein
MRVRDIIHPVGGRLRIVLDREPGTAAPIGRLSDPGRPERPVILLDGLGLDLLAGFLLNAGLADHGRLADEESQSDWPLRLRLVDEQGRASVVLYQEKRMLAVPDVFWDRLYGELLLVVAHARHMQAPAGPAVQPWAPPARLLH